MARYAEANAIPWIRFAKGDRKIDVVRPYLEAAERAGRPGVVAIGVAQARWAYDGSAQGGKKIAFGNTWVIAAIVILSPRRSVFDV